MTAFVLGALAGLAVALPVGPVGVLLLRSGLVDGVRVAVSAAYGIATVDALYAAAAVAVGGPVSRVLGPHAGVVRAMSAAVLIGVGVVGLLRSAPDAAAADERTASGTYLRFVGLTAINPLTAVTFTTVAVGMAAGLGRGGSDLVAFVVGVGLASLGWQLVLALASGLLGVRLGPAVREWVSRAGSVLVVLVGVVMLV